jgi:hypothetical protein
MDLHVGESWLGFKVSMVLMVIVRGKRPVSGRIALTILPASAPPILTPATPGDREGKTARFEPDPPHDLARVGAADPHAGHLLKGGRCHATDVPER